MESELFWCQKPISVYKNITSHPVQLSLAIPAWVRAMNAGQRAWCSVAGE